MCGVQMYTHLPQDTSRGQWISIWSQLSPTFTQVPGIKPRWSGLHSKCLHSQSDLTSSTMVLDKELTFFLGHVCCYDVSFVIILHKEGSHKYTSKGIRDSLFWSQI